MAGTGRHGSIRLVRRTRTTPLASTALQSAAALVVAMPVGAQPAPNARPVGGVVVGGTAVIGQTASNTSITQSSGRAAIDWRSFDVGSHQSVTFKQPSAQAITLNTVTGPNPSQIAGRINANGQIVLVNQSGVTFYKGAQVNVAGLMVSAAGANTAQFMAGGNIAFDKGGNPNARIVNDGSITINGAGLASLVAPSVANSGVINARLGHVVLAGAKTATLDLYGDKLVNVVVTGAVTQTPDGADALVTNTGVIRADGGTIRLTAKAIDGLVTNLVSAGGTIEANTVGSNQGRIIIGGVAGGSITIDGVVSATGNEPGTRGGQIVLKAAEGVTVKSAAVVNASGTAGGGTVAIGTTLKRANGGPAVIGAKTAKGVLVQQGAAIAANATAKGNGGRVVALGSQLTDMVGSISVQGGPAGGDGGFVETSGGVLVLTGKVDASAPRGKPGTLLLDPLDLYISDTQPAAATYTVVGGDLPTILANGAPDSGTVSWVTPTLLQNQAADLSLAASRSLFVKTSVGTPNTLSIGAHNLTLTSLATLSIDAGFVINANDVNLFTQGATATARSPAVNADLINFGTVNATGNISMRAGFGYQTNAGTLIAPNGTISLNNGDITHSGVMRAAAVNIFGENVRLSGTIVTQAPTPTSTTDGISVTAHLDQVFDTASTLTLNGGTVAAVGGDVRLVGAGGISINGATISASSGTFASGVLSLSSSLGGVSQDASSHINVSTLVSAGTIAQSVSLIGTANAIGTLGSFAVADRDFALRNATNLLVTGPVSASNIFIEGNTAGSVITLSNATLQMSSNSPGDGRISLIADSVTATGTVSVNAAPFATNGTVELSPFSVGQPMTVGGTDNTFDDILLSRINVGSAGTLAVGRYTDVTGNIQTPTGNLTVGGPVAAPTLILAAAGPGGVSVDGGMVLGGTIVRANPIATGTAVIQAPSLAVRNAGTIMAGSFGYGSASNGGTVTLGLTGGLASMAGISATDVVIGTVPGYSTAAQIDVVGAFDAGGLPLTLNAAGAVTGTAPLLNVAALNGTAGSYALTSRQNAITQIGTGALIATTGNIIIVDSVAMQVAGLINAQSGNVLLQEVTTGTAINFTDNSRVQSVNGGTIGLVADRINVGTLVSIDATAGGTLAGTVEIAPATGGSAISLGGTAGLSINANLLNAITASNLRIGGYHDSTSGTPVDRVTAGDLAIGSLVNLTAGQILSLDADGSITEGAFGTIIAGTLNARVTGGVGATPGSIVLNTPGNAIGTLGTVTTASGDVSVTNSIPALTIANTSTVAGNNVTIVNQGSIAIGGTLAVGGTASVLGKLVVNASAGDIVINGPASVSAPELVTLSARDSIIQGGGLVHAADVVLSAGTVTQTGGTVFGQGTGGSAVRISASTGGFTQVAASPLSPPIVTSNSNIAINAGTVTSNGTTIAVGTLTGTVATLNQLGGAIVAGQGVDLPGANVAQSSGFLNGGSRLTTSNYQGGGTLAANFISISIGGAGGTLPAFAGAASVVPGSAPGSPTPLTLPQYSVAGRPQTIQVAYAGDTTISRPLAADTVIFNGTAGANLSETSGSIQAATLTGSANGNVLLIGSANAVANLGPYSESGTFALNNAQSLNVTGTIGPTGTLAVNIALAATGGLNLGASVTGTGVDLTADGGAITQTGSAIVTAATLAVSGNAVALTGNNNVGTLAAGTASSGNFQLTDTAALTVAGTVSGTTGVTLAASGPVLVLGDVSVLNGDTGNVMITSSDPINGVTVNGGSVIANGNTVSVSAASLSIVNAGRINTATFEFGPGISQGTLLNGGTIALSSASGLTGVTATDAIRIGRVHGTTQATAITINGFDGAGAPVLELDATGAVTQTGSLVNVATLSGSAGSFNLPMLTNTIGTIGGSTGLVAVGSGSSPGAIIIGDSQALTLSGLVSAASGQVDLSTTGANASVTQGASGTLVAARLTSAGGISGAASFQGAGNQIGILANFSAASLAVNDAIALTLADTVSAPTISLSAPSIAIGGLLTDGGSGTVNLVAMNGQINEAGTLIAGTLSGSSTGSLLLDGVNQVATLGNITAEGFSFVDSTSLLISGTVQGGASATIVSSSALTIGGVVTANTVALMGADIAIPGTVSDHGTVHLSATTGSITETGTLIAGTLFGSSAGSTTLAGATETTNQVGTLGPFYAGTGFLLRDGQPLVVTGPVAVGSGGVTISTSSGPGAPADLAVAGAIIAPTGTVALTATGNTFETGNGLVSAAFARVSAGTNPDGSPFLTTGPAASVNYPNNNVVGGVVAFGLGGVVFNPKLSFQPVTPTSLPFNVSVDLLAGGAFFKDDGGGILVHASGRLNYQFGAFILGAISYPSDEADLLLPLISDLEY